MTTMEKVRNRVEGIVDPETGLTFGEMRLIKEVKEENSGIIQIIFKPTSPFCPIALRFAADIREEALKVEGVSKVLVYCRGHIMEEKINQIINEETPPKK